MRGKLFTKILSAAISAAMLITSMPAALPAAPAKQAQGDENLLKLWYDEPASKGVNILGAGAYGTTAEDNNWQQQTLPIGNSYMGANVYGEIANERLTFNHKALWNGGPSSRRPDYNGGNIFTKNGKQMSEIYQEVVNAFLEGNASASNMCNNIVGAGGNDGYGAYQSWGDIYLTYSGLTNETATTDYERNLDLSTGVANVDFTADGTSYHREYFISHPDNVLVMKLTADGGTMDVNVRFPVDNAENVTARNLGKDVAYTADASAGTLVTAGEMQDNQMKMNSMLKAETDGSIAEGSDSESLDISGASEIIIYVSADTDYKNDYPSYRTGETDEELAASVADTVAEASQKGFDTVKESHLADYKELFDRVSLDLGQAVSEKTTDVLLAAYKDGSASDSEKRLLEVLLYQYGRYMTIASSRAGDLPSNLQGVWQNRVGDYNRVAWGSDFHMNVNLQMNYWPTYSANLAECAIPIIDYVDSLREPGRVTAEAYYGIKSEEGEENGFSAHTQNTPFGWTCPGWDFSWGWSPAAVPWILQNCWEYYEYTNDLDYMREKLYPMMREEAILYDQILVDSGVEITLEDGTKSTRLVSAPAYSPEHGPRTLGNAYENELIWQLYEDAAIAADLLGVDADLAAGWREKQKRLAPIEVGDDGQIKEWFNETTIGSVPSYDSAHRHMSHLLALFPGDQISVENPEYMDAAIVSLNRRPDSSTGWGMGQRINAWARTGDGNRAHKLIQTLMKDGIYPNLWDAHPPFQIDGNFGYTSGVDEMLMQSNTGYINLLPAIPDVWANGEVNGILARGNFEIDMAWSNGWLNNVEITSNKGNEAIVQGEYIAWADVTDADGNPVEVTKISDNRISFDTEEGKTYQISGFPAKEEAPENLKIAEKAKDSVSLAWDAVALAGVTYNVYRQTEGGSKMMIASGISGTSYTDETAYDILGKLTYQVTAGSGITESVMSAAAERAESVLMVDDRDSKVQYSGSWGNWDESSNYNGTIKFLDNPTGTETATLSFTGCGIELISARNADRGMLEISIDGEVCETADTYASSSEKQAVIFSKKGLAAGDHTIVARATNTKSSGSTGTKVEIDGFRVFVEEVLAPTLSADSDYQILATESGRVMAQWKETADADSYNIYVNGELAGSSDAPYAWIDAAAGEAQNIVIKPVVGAQETASQVSFGVTAPVEPEAPAKVTGLTAVRDAADASSVKVSWNASAGAERYIVFVGNKQKASVTETGATLTGLDQKKTFSIRVFAATGNKTSEYAETVVEAVTPIPVTGISVTETTKELKVKDTYQIHASAEPKNADNKTLSYQSSKAAVASVSGSGMVTAIAEGEADIVITSVSSPKVTATVHIKVVKAAEGGPGQTELPKKDSEIADGDIVYVVTKSGAKNGAVSVKGLTAASKNKKSVKIPDTVKKAGYTFKVTAISKNAFQKTGLKSIVIGSNVTSIGANSFNKCGKLASIRFMGKKAPKSIGKNAFKAIKKNCKIFCPKKMKSSELRKLKKKMKSAGKKIVYKRK